MRVLIVDDEAPARARLRRMLAPQNGIEALAEAQAENDVMAAHRLLKAAYITDVSPILAEARRRQGGAHDPIAAYRAAGYRARVAKDRPVIKGASSGIV